MFHLSYSCTLQNSLYGTEFYPSVEITGNKLRYTYERSRFVFGIDTRNNRNDTIWSYALKSDSCFISNASIDSILALVAPLDGKKLYLNATKNCDDPWRFQHFLRVEKDGNSIEFEMAGGFQDFMMRIAKIINRHLGHGSHIYTCEPENNNAIVPSTTKDKGWLGDKIDKRTQDSLRKIYDSLKPFIDAFHQKETAFKKINFAKIECVRLKPKHNPKKASAIRNGEFDSSRIDIRRYIEKDDQQWVLKLVLNQNKFPKKLNNAYTPMQGFIFYDENGKYIGFIEFCFETHTMKATRNIPWLGEPGYSSYAQLANIMFLYDTMEPEEYNRHKRKDSDYQ